MSRLNSVVGQGRALRRRPTPPVTSVTNSLQHVTFAACILILALGLGGATAAFSALYAVVLRPLPYPDPDSPVVIHSQFRRLHMPKLSVSPPDYRDLQHNPELFRSSGVFFYLDLSRTGIAPPQKVNAVAVTTSLFETLDVKPFGAHYRRPRSSIGPSLPDSPSHPGDV
ncbi:MAG TPA: hypothetical protein VGK64_31325 [Bryobacteraceae bacterium]